MKSCPRCGKSYEDDQAYCGVDGASLSGSIKTPTAESRTLRAGAQIGVYRILSVIGKGGMGIVYAAEHTRLGKKVAIKVLRSELVEDDVQVARFFAEARTANSVGHENIVEVHDFIEEGPYRAFVMELIEGITLSRELVAEKPLPLPRLARIGRQVADALAAVHDKQIVHRDLKPDNIFLTTRARQPDFVKLLDFGVAKLMQQTGDSLTQAGQVLGTPAYMAPEQLRGEGVGTRADIYSLGCILYQMASGKRPFRAKTVPELMMKQVHDPPPPFSSWPGLPKVDVSLEKLILQCLDKDPAKRPADMREVEARLAAIEELVTGGFFSGPHAPTSSGAIPAAPGPPAASSPTTVEAELTPGATPSVARALAGELAATQEGAALDVEPIASELEALALPKSRAPLVAAAIGAVMVVAAVVVVVVARGGDEQQTAADTVTTPGAKPLVVRVETTPPGAELHLGDSLIGASPVTLTLDRAAAGRELRIELPGHRTVLRELPGEDGAISVTLVVDAPVAGDEQQVDPPTETHTQDPAGAESKPTKPKPSPKPAKPKPAKRPKEAPLDPFK
ncbi:MAG: serine/threonine protein kinase [Deltaproteobacteria bacterium]|nr:serine/threonine protein kinase [Deltaproteobacteria bacterium]